MNVYQILCERKIFQTIVINLIVIYLVFVHKVFVIKRHHARTEWIFGAGKLVFAYMGKLGAKDSDSEESRLFSLSADRLPVFFSCL